ncbi:hypothetical protein DFA_12107 [Cavenderia fasciculata]|uniref:Uncharacterized protein n=1 Tax=Cavenderia fasciculata TaxID=261658 RepID=F4QFU0_CACFS|nr:uncharacterized protein DFA_12107 [Cavenderia fasciculata]EGG14337.1 hypothetical protein DFA_12107 [Cavenderia fasciculata]|eukprot:XP_004351046.1 hypothetical protein DFA_12107 [Cavenderia fasciculata]
MNVFQIINQISINININITNNNWINFTTTTTGATCGWKLTLNNFKDLNGICYCPKNESIYTYKHLSNHHHSLSSHYPVNGFGTNHVVGTTPLDSLGVKTAMDAPKLDTVNDQIRGDGGKTLVDINSQHIAKPLSAPKSDVVNDQIRGDGGKTLVDINSQHIAKPLSAPKSDVVNDQIKYGK